MSLFVCPLCGKSNSTRRYDPRSLELDVKARNLKGRGRGKGFIVVNEWSILEGDPKWLKGMGQRLLDVVALFQEHDVVSTDEIRARFGLEENEEEQQEEAQEEEESYTVNDSGSEEEMEKQVGAIADAIDLDPEAIPGDTSFERLEKAISLLINEFLSATAIEE
jgi:hypothetical protein